MTIQEKLDAIIRKTNSLLCVGLDTDVEKLPAHLKGTKNAIFEFNKAIIDATHDLVCAYKPNTAFYEAEGAEGIEQLKMTFDYLASTYSEIVTIVDAKRADIGNTNNGYVTFAFDYLNADSITLHPYLGKEALQPFLDRKDKAAIILCKTSNPGSGEFQDLKFDTGDHHYDLREDENSPVYSNSLHLAVAKHVAESWNSNNNCMLVVGATYPEELKKVRIVVGDMTLLVPGVGAQGGDVEKTVQAGLNSQKTGIIVNSSRGIIFASSGKDFAEKAREEAMKLRDEINKYRG